jgi:hypothetical protein
VADLATEMCDVLPSALHAFKEVEVAKLDTISGDFDI